MNVRMGCSRASRLPSVRGCDCPMPTLLLSLWWAPLQARWMAIRTTQLGPWFYMVLPILMANSWSHSQLIMVWFVLLCSITWHSYLFFFWCLPIFWFVLACHLVMVYRQPHFFGLWLSTHYGAVVPENVHPQTQWYPTTIAVKVVISSGG